TLAEIEKASTVAEAANRNTPIAPGSPTAQPFKTAPAALFLSAAIAVGTAVIFFNFMGRNLASAGRSGRARRTTVSRSLVEPSSEAEAEMLLQKLVAGDSDAADQIFEMAGRWTGKTERTAKATQLITTAINLPDLHTRQAALRAELALDGVTVDAAGLAWLEQ